MWPSPPRHFLAAAYAGYYVVHHQDQQDVYEYTVVNSLTPSLMATLNTPELTDHGTAHGYEHVAF
jgi:hypothetical protein